MWNYVGIVRSDERLARARRRAALISEEVEDYYRRFAVTADFLELRNLALCAAAIIESACRRRESRGLHYNADCPQPAPVARNTALRLNAAGEFAPD
jgi:L-aspartate oxidase